jgi:hypothetical protein
MTEHYVTLFDATFLPQGLALHRSLQRHAGNHSLWVIAMDAATEGVLGRLALPDVRVIPLREIESPALTAVRPSRSIAEYCWTITPFTPDAVFERSDANRVTYIDADMWLLGDPTPIFREMIDTRATSLITEHAYAPEYEQSADYGRFCVQFMPFERESSDVIRHRWQQQCLDWCYAEPDGERFGDQKYLDSWPADYGSAVRVLGDRSLIQAPWNAVQFPPRQAVAFHFHRLRIVARDRVYPGLYRLPREHRAHVYRPYLVDLRESCDRLSSLGVPIPIQYRLPTGLAGIKDRVAFHAHNWRSPTTPYTMSF